MPMAKAGLAASGGVAQTAVAAGLIHDGMTTRTMSEQGI